MFEQEFMKAHGLAVQDDHVSVRGFKPTADTCPDTFIALITGFSLLHVTGGDAAGFLHNQFTCDVNALADGGGCPGAWCTPKGRVITTFLLYRDGGEFYLLLPAVLKERFVKRLRMYVLRADVNIVDMSEGYSIMGARGRSGAIPESDSEYSVHQLNNRLHLFLPDVSASRCLIIDETPALQSVWEELSQSMSPADSRCWDCLDMERGIAWLSDATSEQFLPQELNLEDIGGLSFTKGCYPGQEIVARVHYRGQAKRRMYGGHAETGTAACPGMKLVDDSGKTAGSIIRSVPASGNSVRILAVISIAATKSDAVQLEDGSSLQIDFPNPRQK